MPAEHSLSDPHKIDGSAQIECQLRDSLRISGLATLNKERDKEGRKGERSDRRPSEVTLLALSCLLSFCSPSVIVFRYLPSLPSSPSLALNFALARSLPSFSYSSAGLRKNPVCQQISEWPKCPPISDKWCSVEFHQNSLNLLPCCQDCPQSANAPATII